MDANHVLALGLVIAPLWRLVGQRLNTDERPNALHVEVAADRGKGRGGAAGPIGWPIVPAPPPNLPERSA